MDNLTIFGRICRILVDAAAFLRSKFQTKEMTSSVSQPATTDIFRHPVTVDVRTNEPLLYDELVRRQQSLLVELEKKKIDSWETLEKQSPDIAKRLWDRLQRGKMLYNWEMLQYLETPYGGMSPKEYATNFYNKTLFWIYDCHIGTRKNEEDGYFLLASLALWGDEAVSFHVSRFLAFLLFSGVSLAQDRPFSFIFPYPLRPQPCPSFAKNLSCHTKPNVSLPIPITFSPRPTQPLRRPTPYECYVCLPQSTDPSANANNSRSPNDAKCNPETAMPRRYLDQDC